MLLFMSRIECVFPGKTFGRRSSVQEYENLGMARRLVSWASCADIGISRVLLRGIYEEDM